MKQYQRILFIIASVLGSIFIIIILYIDSFEPEYSNHIKLEGIRNRTEVSFDEFGIPHIYADNEQDLFFTLGYVHTMERLFQMEMIRRLGSGRLAEILGEDLVETDKLFRVLGVAEKAKFNAERIKSKKHTPIYKAAESYLAGINTYIQHGKKPLEFYLLGIEKKPFTFEDLYLTTGYMSFSFMIGLFQDPIVTNIYNKWGEDYIKDLAIDYVSGTERIPIFSQRITSHLSEITDQLIKIGNNLPAPAFMGSNSWVLSPDRTKSGHVILCNDPHIKFSQPAVWYETHLESPKYSVYGNFLAGFPFPVIGHTRDVAWGLTMFENDDVDLFREKVNPENELEYQIDQEWKPFNIREETIKVKDGEDIILEIRETRHGPVVNDILDEVKNNESSPISVWWSWYQLENNELEVLYNLSGSKNINQARNAVSKLFSPGLNIMFGDNEGNIAWWAAAKLPIRPSHVNSKFILDGSSGEDDYLGFYDFTSNPQSENPPGGIVYSANNQPDSIEGILYPGYYCPQNRAARIVSLLGEKEKWDSGDFREMMLDDISNTILYITDELIGIISDGISDSNEFKSYIDILKDWNSSHGKNQIAPTIYYKWLYFILESTFADELGVDRTLFLYNNTFLIKNSLPQLISNEHSVWWNNVNTKDKTETRVDIIKQALHKTIENLQADWGTDVNEWTWGNIHKLEHVHPVGMQEPFDKIYNVGPFGTWGGSEVINYLNVEMADSKEFYVTFGPSARRIIDFGNIELTDNILPTGQSGHFTSDYYDDQAELYNQGKFRKQRMNRDDILSNTSATFILDPVK